jgi:endonuclease/exonuclease/phosphatase family metal-dependent hydrolase
LRRLADTIRSIDPDILAVNEILDPKRLARFAREKLGSPWKLACAAEGEPQKVGFLYNSSVATLLGHRVFTELFTKLNPRKHRRGCVPARRDLRPAFACRFEVKDTSFDFYAVVIHLKAGACSSVRRAQWRIMEGIVDELAAEDDDILILGDFNEYRRVRRDFDNFCRITGFTLVSGSIPCTKLFKRKGENLDNILVSPAALGAFVKGSARVGGACAKSCTRNRYWKAYLNRVSDHCPVVAEFRTSAP